MSKIPGSRGHAMFWYAIAAVEITFAAVYPFRAPYASFIIGMALVAGLLAIIEARRVPRLNQE